jgi:NitT/TauT family transport system ATP-binding protein
MEGILELLAEEPFNGRADLPKMAEETELTDAELLEVLNALLLLGFAYLTNGDILLTELGGRYVNRNAERQEMFGKQLLEHVPLIAYICHGLEQDKSGDLPEDLFLKLLRFTLSEEEAERALRVAIEWGRYGDLFEYNFNTGVIQRSKRTRKKRIKAWRTRGARRRWFRRSPRPCCAETKPASKAAGAKYTPSSSMGGRSVEALAVPAIISA